MAEAAEGVGGRALPDEKILIPHKEITLTNGTRVTIAPWGLTKGALVLERMNALSPKLLVGDANARQLLSRAWDEVVDLVAMTVGIERAEMERDPMEGGWTFEDMCAVTDAVLEVCVVRSDGAGALPFLLKLVEKMGEIVTRSAGPVLARKQLRDSAAKGTSKARSGNGSVSRPRKTNKRRASRRS